MGLWSAIVLIVLIGSVASVLQARYRAGHGNTDDVMGNEGAPPRGSDAELQREVEHLRERIKVLERIATEDRHSKSIAAEIESLRDR